MEECSFAPQMMTKKGNKTKSRGGGFTIGSGVRSEQTNAYVIEEQNNEYSNEEDEYDAEQ